MLDEGAGAQMSLWDHLDELRRRLTWAVLALVIGTSIGIAVARPVLLYLIEPLPEPDRAITRWCSAFTDAWPD